MSWCLNFMYTSMLTYHHARTFATWSAAATKEHGKSGCADPEGGLVEQQKGLVFEIVCVVLVLLFWHWLNLWHYMWLWDWSCFLVHSECWQEVWYPHENVVFVDGKFIKMDDIHSYRANLVMTGSGVIQTFIDAKCTWSDSCICLQCWFVCMSCRKQGTSPQGCCPAEGAGRWQGARIGGRRRLALIVAEGVLH